MSKKNNNGGNKKASLMVRAKGLHKSYRLGRTTLEVLKGVDFDVRQGEFVAIYGHSGSGKSTLLHLLGLLDTPSSGEIHIDSVNAAELSSSNRNRMRCNDIGFIFQFYQLLPELNMLENTCLPAMVGTGLLQWPGRKKELRKRASELLDDLGLGDRLKHRPKELSGGERQRVAIARALLNRPKLLLADEPTGNLDSTTGRKIMNTLLKYNKKLNQTTLMVTHDRELADLVNRTINLKDGKLA